MVVEINQRALLEISSWKEKDMKNEACFLKKVEFHHGKKAADECRAILATPEGQRLKPLEIVTRAVQKVFGEEILAAEKASKLATNSD